MKTSISSDVWENKKALIAKLYMEEEWPLKQVIKQIRSEDFNPSETQLRSRLKKWRVTKPSRQTRKKPSADDDDSDKDVKRSSTSPITTEPVLWASTYPPYAPALQSNDQPKWNAALASQLTPSPSGEHGLMLERPSAHPYDHSPTTTSFEQPAQTSPVDESLMLNTTSVLTPTYAGYPLSPDSGVPSPGSTTAAIPWQSRAVSVDMGLNPALHPGQWYGMPFEPITPPPGVPHSTHMPPPPGYRDHMPVGVTPAPGVFSPEFASYPTEVPEYHHHHNHHPGYDPKPWKRTMSLHYDYAGHGSARPDHADRKHPHLQTHGHPPSGMVSIPGQPPHMMCAPLLPYMGQDPMIHKQHPGVGY
ncbi:hypothetical protein N7454_006676 [Penicillium verhagenii]|nr:hypothetical protein N7454_006676 [Penicillium verhagenii]